MYDHTNCKHVGNFTASSESIVLEGSILSAICMRYDGSYRVSMLQLEEVLITEGGQFRWSPWAAESGPRTITVKPGDTLESIADFCGCTAAFLAERNPFVDGFEADVALQPGLWLHIPGRVFGDMAAEAEYMGLEENGRTLVGCMNYNGQHITTSLCLDQKIANVDGYLSFFKGYILARNENVD
ncbi:hypothetical protein GGR52DRAFT_249228 [Hypoxylon sp. FL1284]|nr:hypothetical protein GGR52DRAFT_249228 [Hypoxylon sp. FL1284]